MSEIVDPLRSALVVDDDAIIRMDACAILEEAGFEASEATDADQALTMLRASDGQVGLLFTDVDMPNGSMNGFALARAVSESWPHVGILVASGRHKAEPGDMPEGSTFVAKPFSAEVVQDRLREILPDLRQPEPLRNVDR